MAETTDTVGIPATPEAPFSDWNRAEKHEILDQFRIWRLYVITLRERMADFMKHKEVPDSVFSALGAHEMSLVGVLERLDIHRKRLDALEEGVKTLTDQLARIERKLTNGNSK